KTDGLIYGATTQTGHPRYHGALFRRNYPELQEMIDRARVSFTRVGARWNEQKKRFTFPSGARISFFYCERVGDEDAHLGKEYQYLGFDQLEQFTEKQYTTLISCARASVPGLRVKVRATFNPGGEGHQFVKKRFYDLGPLTPYIDSRTGLSRVFVPARVWDNPAILKNDPAYVQRLLAISDPALRRAYLEGDMKVFSGQYFSEWRDELHVVEPCEQFRMPPHWGRSGGLDWGFSPHPGVLLICAYDPHGRPWAYKELVYQEETPLSLADLIAEQVLTEDAERRMLIRADTQMWEKDTRKGLSIAEEVNRRLHNHHHLQVTLVQARKDRINGWARVHQYLDPRRKGPDGDGRGPWLRFFRSNPELPGYGCPYAIETIPAQIHDPLKPGDLKKGKGESATDHAADALRYELMDQPALTVMPLDEQPARPHHRAVHDRVKQRLLEAIQEHNAGAAADDELTGSFAGELQALAPDDPKLLADLYQ
ncbi:MAG: terminase large subunit domain-containing protein, partial [bacterium]